MKKTVLMILLFVMSFTAFAYEVGLELGIGSGFVYYGDSDVRSRNKSVSKMSQVVAETSAAFLFPVSRFVFLSLGADTVLDARWGDGEYVYLWDYCGEFGFKVYPGFGGLHFSVDYAFGRRTDFFDLDGDDYTVKNTKWGNGFALEAAYNFGFEKKFFTPEIGASWRHMPRGDSGDNIICVFIRIADI